MTDSNARDTSVSGVWSGRFWYAESSFHIPTTVPFTAHLSEVNGAVSGTTLEPNTFADNGLHELTGVINGMMIDDVVQFSKLYDPLPNVHQLPIQYMGDVYEDANRIAGGWTIESNELGSVFGEFELIRVSQMATLDRAAHIAMSK